MFATSAAESNYSHSSTISLQGVITTFLHLSFRFSCASSPITQTRINSVPTSRPLAI
nr:MAG TPA: hypothetical protein [Caudoviricetes sp.]